MQQIINWSQYIIQMEQILALELDEARRTELLIQLERIAALAGPLMAFPLDERIEVAGVFHS
ncbi:oxalurate catabolism protein HpxX [Pantoea sp. Nvir]|uniref:oxalurate catabolism protein HpxX n=1 Tax=Pantoea sp. Nvir TaxID=2576760 RepID=UPI00135B8FBC|nr:oxalurate catabolism protein HpxX [Pantoea sp. Nvir]MXP66960.1 oxalurate catabolism protein HpxX [Pantoea sp. Nvir]CAJ0992496.1 hypothetical protein NVIRPANT_00675 [Pantoea sp. Nvir]